MPELPEIDHLKRSLEPVLVGRCFERVRLVRPDVVRNAGRAAGPRDLLGGETVRALARHGKELAIEGVCGRVIVVHLGMSGQLRHCPAGRRLPRADHVHCIWRLAGGGRLVFRDPRRFGGLWALGSRQELAARWSRLGPDAISITSAQLDRALARTRRPVKAALLDQRVLAGVGNIYADEILFAAHIDPRSPATSIGPDVRRRLAATIRSTLRRACRYGGSTIRDYVDGNGRAGAFTQRHRVYGRGSRPCVACGRPLRALAIAQRTTVFCEWCQKLFSPSPSYSPVRM